ncbi:MAG: hypothetical protein ACXV8G_14865, partial [Acidimicrobiales bacterium]
MRASIVVRWWPVLVAAAACTILTVVVSTTVFPSGTSDLDEVAYQAQGLALADGHLTLPASEVVPSFRPYLSGTHDDQVVFKYQPLWPSLIGVSQKAFGTTRVLQAAMSFAGVLAAAWFAFELLRSRRAAIFASVLFAATPFVWLQSATLLAYFPSLVLLLGASAALVRASRRHTMGAAVVAGLLVGASVMNRPFDGILATLPVIVYALLTTGRANLARLVGGLVLGGLPFLVLVLAYNTAVMGSPLTFPFDASGGIDQFGFGWRASFVIEGVGHEGQVHFTPSLALSAAWSSLAALPLFLLAAPGLLGLAVVSAWLNRRDRRAWLLLASAATVLVGYLFWWGVANAVEFGLPRVLGPFYYMPLLIPIVTLTAWILDQHWDTKRSWFMAGFVVVVLVNAPFNLGAFDRASTAGTDRDREVASFGGPSPRLVIAPPGFPHDPYIRYANDASLGGDQIVAVDAEDDRLALMDRFSDRTVILLQDYHPVGDLFGPTTRTRSEVVAQRGARLEIDVSPVGTPSDPSVAYVRFGDTVLVG